MSTYGFHGTVDTSSFPGVSSGNIIDGSLTYSPSDLVSAQGTGFFIANGSPSNRISVTVSTSTGQKSFATPLGPTSVFTLSLAPGNTNDELVVGSSTATASSPSALKLILDYPSGTLFSSNLGPSINSSLFSKLALIFTDPTNGFSFSATLDNIH